MLSYSSLMYCFSSLIFTAFCVSLLEGIDSLFLLLSISTFSFDSSTFFWGEFDLEPKLSEIRCISVERS